MPADVRAAIRDIIAAHMPRAAAGGTSHESEQSRDPVLLRMAESKLQSMEREGRYIVETWS
jgi:hypothetical protein